MKSKGCSMISSARSSELEVRCVQRESPEERWSRRTPAVDPTARVGPLQNRGTPEKAGLWSRRRPGAIGLACLAAAAWLGTISAWPANPEYRLDPGDYPPPTAWTANWTGGVPSILVFYGNDPLGYGKEQRKLVELKRALGGELDYVVFTQFGSQAARRDEQRANELLNQRQWDVLLFWSSPEGHTPSNCWGLLSTPLKYRILSLASEGTGLLFLGGRANYRGYPTGIMTAERRRPPPGADLFAGLGMLGREPRSGPDYWGHLGVGWSGPRPADEAAFRQAYLQEFDLGPGRALALERTPVTSLGGQLWIEAMPVTWRQRIDPDYFHAELLRAILYAAGREPMVRFVRQPPSPWKVDWNTPATAEWAVEVDGEARDLTIAWRLRDLMGAVLVQGQETFPKAKGHFDFACKLPALGVGHYYVDLFVDGPDGREAYGYAGLVVTTGYALDLSTVKPAVFPGDQVEGVVRLRQPNVADSANAPQPTAVAVRLLDTHDRLLESRELPLADDGSAAFSFATEALEGVLLRLEAEALAAGQRVAAEATTVNLLQRRRGQFNVAVWGGPTGVYALPIMQRLWSSGVTATMHNPNGLLGDMMEVPFIGGNGWKGVLDGQEVTVWTTVKEDPETGVPTMQPACWNNVASFERILDFKDGTWQHGEQRPVYVYNLYDEGPHSGCCLAESCLAAYREWLKEQYGGDLEALNREWLSAYTSWDQVAVLHANDNLEEKAKAEGNFARWSDRHHFNQVNFCRRILGGLTRRAQAVDPGARIGFEGSGGFGMDFDELFANSGFWCPYNGMQMDILRSLAPPGYVYGYWIGYSKDAETIIGQTWDMVLDGSPSVWWWMYPGRGRFHGWFADDGMPYPSRQRLIDECILPLRRGLGDLLVRTPRTHDGVALYYSVAATHADQVDRERPFTDFMEASTSAAALLDDLGVQWIYTTKKGLLAGDLARRGVKVLVLPSIRPLGEDEVAALRTFVEGGGTLLADVRPGVLSGHCRPLASGPADALFGIRRTGPGKATWLDGTLEAHLFGKPLTLTLAGTRGDAELEAAEATPAATLDGLPVVFTNPLGQGRAVLLNYHFCHFTVERETAFGRSLGEIFAAVFEQAGIARQLDCRRPDGRPTPRTRRTTWRQGGLTLHGLLTGTDGGPVELVLPEAGHLFSLRTGYLGQANRVALAELKADQAEFVAAYPYDPGVPQIDPLKSVSQAGEAIELAIHMSGVPDGETAVFSYETRLCDPDGNWVDAIPWSVQGVGGQARLRLRFAHNDKPGSWRLTVREITTGRAAACELELRR